MGVKIIVLVNMEKTGIVQTVEGVFCPDMVRYGVPISFIAAD